MKNYIEDLEYDEESDYILSVIEDCEKQGLTTNVDFTLAEKEKDIIESKQQNLEIKIIEEKHKRVCRQ